MWLREHRLAAGVALLLLVLGTLSVLGVGNEGVPWRWGAGAGRAWEVGPEIGRGVPAVAWDGRGWTGAADPRRDGAVGTARSR